MLNACQTINPPSNRVFLYSLNFLSIIGLPSRDFIPGILLPTSTALEQSTSSLCLGDFGLVSQDILNTGVSSDQKTQRTERCNKHVFGDCCASDTTIPECY